MRRTQIYLDEQTDEQLRQRAVADGRSAAAIIRDALRVYLARDDFEASGPDPILALAGTVVGLPPDAAVEHDRDLYGKGARTSSARR